VKGVFVWKVQPGMEAEFERRWQVGSARFQEKPGAQGTRLHKGIDDPTLYVGYAGWESYEHRRRAQIVQTAEEAASAELRAQNVGPISQVLFAGFFEEPHVTVLPVQPPTSNLRSTGAGS
jgi:heme-degrading monooxygenase HmoA